VLSGPGCSPTAKVRKHRQTAKSCIIRMSDPSSGSNRGHPGGPPPCRTQCVEPIGVDPQLVDTQFRVPVVLPLMMPRDPLPEVNVCSQASVQLCPFSQIWEQFRIVSTNVPSLSVDQVPAAGFE
jgi:hypothetical protein